MRTLLPLRQVEVPSLENEFRSLCVAPPRRHIADPGDLAGEPTPSPAPPIGVKRRRAGASRMCESDSVQAGGADEHHLANPGAMAAGTTRTSCRRAATPRHRAGLLRTR